MPKAVVNEQRWVPATMEGVVERLGSALLKVVSNKGAAGPDGMTIEALQAQWPNVSCRLRDPAGRDVASGRGSPGVDPQGGRRAARAGDPQRGRQGGDGGRAAGARAAV